MLSLAQTIKDIKNNIANIFNTMAPKTYVDKKVADLVNGAPEQLDTLQELSKALNNDKDFATTVNNSIAKKLNLTGGTITGNLTVNGTLTGKASTAGVADRALKADTCTGNAASASSVAWNNVTGKPSLMATDGGTFTGNITLQGNAKQISYQGSKATNPMIRFLDNNVDTYGNGISIGGGGVTIVGAGEGAQTAETKFSGGDESLVLASDGDIHIYTKTDGGIDKAWHGTIDTNGLFSGKAATAGTADTANSVAWGNVSGKPSTFTPSAHNHDSAYPSTTGTRASGTWGINVTGSAGSVAWGNVTGKPSTFAPSSHNHDSAYPSTTGTRASGTWGINVTGSAGSVAWGNVSGKPSTFTPSGHNHAWGDITGAPAQATRWPTWGEVTGKPGSFTPAAHSHAWNDITGKPSTFTPSGHTHGWGEITGKPSSIIAVESWDAGAGVLKLKTV